MPELKNLKRDRFAREYVVDHNATQAAIRAGYSAKAAHVTGARLLKDAKVRAKIAHLTEKVNESTRLDAEWVRKSLQEIYDAGMSEITVTGKEGEVLGYRRENLGAAARAVELVGKLADVQAFRENIEVTRKVRVIDLTGDE
jgi:phage terminase small subunit